MDRQNRAAAPCAKRPRHAAVELVIRWDDEPIFAEVLDARRDFWVGNADADSLVDFEVADGAVESSFPLIIGSRSKRATMLVPDGVDCTVALSGQEPTVLGDADAQVEHTVEPRGRKVELPLGSVAVLRIGRLGLRLRAVLPEARQRWRLPRSARRFALCLLVSMALFAGFAVVCHNAPPEARDESGLTDSQRYLIQQYLDSVAEAELEQIEAEDAEEGARGMREGGTGNRYGVSGPTDQHISRATALREAAEFGMIGMLNSGAGGDPDAPVAPWGRDARVAAKRKLRSWKRSPLVPNTTKLTVGSDETLPLRAMQAKVSVDGFRARVVLDYFFDNPHSRRLEGNFKLRLPDGASPYFLAFGETAAKAAIPALHRPSKMRQMGAEPAEIMKDRARAWKKPKEARMVPREKAVQAYEDTVHRKIDPALLEWAGAGIYSTRVFPIEPRSLHRVVIGYDMDLTAVGDDLELRFDVPDNIPQVAVQLDVAELPGTTATVSPAVAPLRSVAGRRHYDFRGQDARTITLQLARPPVLALRHRDGASNGYFAAAFKAKLPANAVQGSDRAVLLVDTSLSSNPDAYRVWLMLLEALLTNNRASLKQFAVLFFDIEARWWRQSFSANTAQNVAALMQHARQLALEGATDLGSALGEGVQPSWLSQPSAHDIFLLSDGNATWGESSLYAMSKKLEQSGGAMFAYRTGLAGSDVGALEHLTREAGGAVFALTDGMQIATASLAHRQRPWRIVRTSAPGGHDIMLAGRPSALFPGQRVVMVGRGELDPSAPLEVVVRQPGAEARTLQVELGEVVDSPLAERTYGQIAVGQLEALEGVAADVARAYALHFRVPGKSASLLMLESEAEYARYNIKPASELRTVRRNAASHVVQDTLALASAELGDPKAAFMRSLDKLERMPGVALRLSDQARAMIAAMDPAHFEVSGRLLRSKQHEAASRLNGFAVQLASRSFTYDSITTEAARRYQQVGAASALRAASSLIEQSPGDAVLQRDVGYSAMEWGLPAQAYGVFRRVADARPFEPQSYRAIARALVAMKRADLAMAYYEIGLADAWRSRYPDFHTVVATEYLDLLNRVERGELAVHDPALAQQRRQILTALLSGSRSDLVVMITWNTNATDIDLHVQEPSGEVCYYQHSRTASGGRLTRDVTSGYGPEMYRLARAPAGRYRIKAKFYSSNRTRLSARTKVHAVVIEGFGSVSQRMSETTVTLRDASEVQDIAVVTVGDRRTTMLSK